MKNQFDVLVIDDQLNIKDLIQPLVEILSYKEIFLNVTYVHEIKNLTEQINKPFDIILFDSQLGSTDFAKIEGVSQGFNLIKDFRKTNKRTKIIFYSSSFNLDHGDQIPLSHRDYFTMINELNVYKMVYKNDVEELLTAIEGAINSLDIVMTTLDKMVEEYSELELTYNIDGEDIPLKDLICDFKMDGELSGNFKKNLNEMIATYFLNATIEDK